MKVTLFNTVFESTSIIEVNDIFSLLERRYNSTAGIGSISEENKLKDIAINSIEYNATTTGQAIRRKDNSKRWNGCIFVDIDAGKYKYSYSQSVFDKDVKVIQDYFSSFQITNKISSSGKGVHGIIVCDVSKCSDEQTLEIYEGVYTHYVNKIEKDLKTLGLTVPYEVDRKFISNSTLCLTLSNSKDVRIEYSEISSDRIQEIVTAWKPYLKIKSSKYIVTELSKGDKDKLKATVAKMLPKVRLRFNGNEERYAVAVLLNQLGYTKEDWKALKKYDKKTTNGEWLGQWSYAERNYNEDRFKAVWKRALRYLNDAACTEYWVSINQSEEILDNKTISVNKYIIEAYNEVKDFIDNNNKVLMKAPTGAGKSTFAIQYIKEYQTLYPEKYIVIACDTIALANQISIQNNIPVLSSEVNNNTVKVANTSGIYISTYDSLKKFTQIDLLIVDEAHQLVTAESYRHKALELLYNWMCNTKTVCITATPDYLYPLLNEYEVLNIEVKDRVKNNYLILSGKNKTKIGNKVISYIKSFPLKGKKAVVYINSIDKLEYIKAIINKELPQYKVELFKSGCNSKALRAIQDTSLIPNDVDIVLTTSILQNGVNIQNNDIAYVFTTELERTAFIQFEARFRKGGIYVILLGEINDESKTMLKGVNEYESIVSKSKRDIDTLNKIQALKEKNKLYREKKYEYSYFLDEELNEYVVSHFGCAFEILRNNTYFYKSNPQMLIPESTVLSLSDKVNKLIEEKVVKGRQESKSELTDWFFLNVKKVYEILSKKNKKDLSVRATAFYLNNEDKLNSKEIERLFKSVKKLMNAFTGFIDIKQACEILKLERNEKVIISGFYFNLMNDIKHKAYHQWFIDHIQTKEHIYLLFLKELGNRIELGKEYTNDMIKQEVDYVLSKKNFSFINISSENDTAISEALNTLFKVSEDRKMKDGERVRYRVFGKWESPIQLNKFKKAIKNTIVTSHITNWFGTYVYQK